MPSYTDNKQVTNQNRFIYGQMLVHHPQSSKARCYRIDPITDGNKIYFPNP